jgi:hypothetical protein
MRNLLWFVSIAALFSCKNENQPPTPPAPETLKHVPLTLGSFWVYEHFAVDTANGINASTGVKDSIVIHSDTIINGKNYVVRKGIAPFQGVNTWGLIDIVRDSSGYLVNDKGLCSLLKTIILTRLMFGRWWLATMILLQTSFIPWRFIWMM